MADHLDWARECEVPNQWEQIAYWSVVLVASICTVLVTFGGIGYLFGLYR